MDIELPNKNTMRWSGCYQGNYYGDLYRTFNIDLESNPGHINLSKGMIKVADTNSTGDSRLANVTVFLPSDAGGTTRWWAACNRLFYTDDSNPLSLDTAKWYEDTLLDLASNPGPTDIEDMATGENDTDNASGNNILLATRDTAVATLNDTASNLWNKNTYFHTSPTALKTGIRHPIEYFPMRRIFVIGDGNLIHTIDKNKTATHTRLTLPYKYRVNHIFVTAYRIWILCYAPDYSTNGVVVEWDGSSETYNNIYDVHGVYPLSGVNYFEIPVILNNRGLFLEYNGNSFSPMVRNGQIMALPFFNESGNAFSLSTSQMPVAPRGMTVSDDGLIYINTTGPANNSFKALGGIWCLNPMAGNIYSKFSLGNPYSGGDTDYGQQLVTTPGAIKAVNVGQSITGSAYLIASATAQLTSYVSSENAIWVVNRSYNSTVRKGWFITQPFFANDIQEQWDVIWLRYSLLKSTGSKIIVKAKGINSLMDVNRRPIQKAITWTAATTFTVTLASGDDALAVGDEVEVINGVNSGQLAHITQITGNHAALQTITIDESMAITSSTSYARFDRWKKIGIINNQTKYFTPLNIGISSSFIQFKVELRGPAGEYEIKKLDANLKSQTIKQK